MKRNIVYIICLFSLLLIGCKAKKNLASEDNHSEHAGLNLKSSRMLKAAFIEAKKEQMIGNKTSAKSMFERVLENDPTCAACAYELARIAIDKNNANEAIKMSEVALKGEPNNPFYIEQKAEIVYRIGNSAQAAKISEKLIDSFPKTRMHYRRTIFYYEKAKSYVDAERVLNKYEKQFGFNYRTAMMYDHLYDMQDFDEGKMANWAKLVQKYPNDIGYRKSYVNSLIDAAKYEKAKTELDALVPKLNQPGYTFLVKSRINSIQKDWPNYIIQLKFIANDTMLSPNLKTRYLVQSVEIKDTAILEPLRIIATQDPAAQAYVNYYLKQFGAQVDESKNLEAKYKSNPEDKAVARSWMNMLYSLKKYKEAGKVSLNLIETNPSLVENYHYHAKNLMAQGLFSDAYSYANQGMVYAISKDEICQSYVLQVLANFYLEKQVNVKEELKLAWANKGSDKVVIQDLCYVSMISGENLNETQQELTRLENGYMKQLHVLYLSDEYSIKAWKTLEQLHSANLRVVEAHLLKASKSGKEIEFNTLKKRMLETFPQNSFYKGLSWSK